MTAYQDVTFNQKWMSLFLFLLFLLCAYAVVAIYAQGIDEAQQSARYRFHRGNEVIDQTIENAFSAQELWFSFDEMLRDFDNTAKSVFGVNHQWPRTNTREHPPRHIRAWLRTYPPSREEELLIQYSRLVENRRFYNAQSKFLEEKVQDSVAALPDDARPNHIMKTELILRSDLERAIEGFSWQQEILNEIVAEYVKKGKSK